MLRKWYHTAHKPLKLTFSINIIPWRFTQSIVCICSTLLYNAIFRVMYIPKFVTEDCFSFLGITNKTVISKSAQDRVDTRFFFSSIYPRVQLLG